MDNQAPENFAFHEVNYSTQVKRSRISFPPQSRFATLATLLLLFALSGQTQQSAAAETGKPNEYEWCPSPSMVHLSVLRHRTVYFSETDADSILSEATDLVQEKDSKDDDSCSVVFTRSGSIDTFSSVPATIVSRRDYEKVINLTGDVKIVRSILWCDGKVDGTILGCAPTPGRSFVVIDMGFYLDSAILWTHEYLHNSGRQHRSGSGLVMNPYHSSTNRVINGAECAALIPYCDMPIPKGTGSPQTKMGKSVDSADKRTPDVLSFVRKRYIHGLPYTEAASFGLDSVPALLKTLSDDNDQDYHANIASVLGLIGGDEAKTGLLDFISKAMDSSHNSITYQASLAAIMSLGYIVNRTGDRDLIEYLSKLAHGLGGATTGTMDDDEIQGQREFHLDTADVARAAIWGLAFGGIKDSRDVLRSLSKLSLSEQDIDLLDDAIGTNIMIHQTGLLEYRK